MGMVSLHNKMIVKLLKTAAMEKQSGNKKVKFFGINIEIDDDTDYRSLIAKMFMCKNLTIDKISHYLEKLEIGALSYEKLNTMLDKKMAKDCLDIEDFYHRLQEWEDGFGPMTKKDKDYLRKQCKSQNHPKKHRRRAHRKVFDKAHNGFNSPKELASMVKQQIKGQDEFIDNLAVLFYTRYINYINQTNSLSHAVVTIGHTAEIFSVFKQVLNMPILMVNLEGGRDENVLDAIKEFLNHNDFSEEEIRYLVIIMTGFDKISNKNSTVFNPFIMFQILKLIEAKDFSDWFIILDGVFDGIEINVGNRLNLIKTMGFLRSDYDSINKNDLILKIKDEDLVDWGVMDDIMRLVNKTYILDPSNDALYQMLADYHDKMIQNHIDFCKQCNIDLNFTNDALSFIESMSSSFIDIMNSIYYEHCGMENANVKQTLTIDKEYVKKQLKK